MNPILIRNALLALLYFSLCLSVIGIAWALGKLLYLDLSLETKSNIVQSFAVALAAIVGGVWAVYRFFIQRAYETALSINLSTVQFTCSRGNYFVFIDVTLENKGQTRISARPKDHRKGADQPVYSDKAETLDHSASLQIRRPNTSTEVTMAFDWFVPEMLERVPGLAHEINLLNEYEVCKDGGVEFWIEPHEKYHCAVPVIIPQGVYLAKVSFLGNRGNFEFWSRVFL